MLQIVKYIILVFILSNGVNLNSQSNISLKYLGLTIHPLGDDMAEFQPYKLDPEAKFVLNFGGVLSLEQFIYNDWLSVKYIQALFADCSAGMASVTHLGVRVRFMNKPKHKLSFGVGPAFMIREDWGRFDGYKSSGTLNRVYSDKFGWLQYKLFWFGIEVEYDFSISERWDLNMSITPGVPAVITYGIGLKYWFNKDFKEKIILPR